MTTNNVIDLGVTVANLSVSDRERYFQILKDNLDLFKKIAPGPFFDLFHQMDLDPNHPMVALYSDHPVIQHLKDWLLNQPD